MKTLLLHHFRKLQMLIVAGILPRFIAAQDSGAPSEAQGDGTIWLILQSIGALLLVLAGIFVTIWLLKYLMNRTSGQLSDGLSTHFTVISKVAISPKHSIYALRSFDDLLIVGTSESGIEMLHRYENFQQWDTIDLKSPNKVSDFTSLFQKILHKEN